MLWPKGAQSQKSVSAQDCQQDAPKGEGPSGLYSPSTLKRIGREPPMHVRGKMTPEQRRLYRIAQGPAEGGHSTAAVKRRLGMKLGNPNLWKLGEGDDRAMLEAMEKEIRSENERGQRSVGSESGA